MRPRLSAAALALAFVLAGCLGANTPEDTGDNDAPIVADGCVEDPIGWTPEGVDVHNHTLHAHHDVSCRMTMLGHQSMIDEEGQFPGAHSMDKHGDLVVVSVDYGNVGRGFDLFDVSDPSDPTLVGTFRDNAASGGDQNVVFSADGKYVFMANEAGGQSAANSAGVRVMDVSDPANPTFASFYQILPSGVHTIEAFAIGDTQYVAALNYGVHILALVDVGGTPRLTTVGRYATATPEQIQASPDIDSTKLQRSVYGHDTRVVEDPLTGQMLMYFAYAYQGVRVLDVSDPSRPTVISQWQPDGEEDEHYIHDAGAFVNVDGRRIMVAEAETFEASHNETPSPIWIVDVTDFDNPRQLAKWSNPGGHGSDSLGLSTHFFDFVDEHVVMAHYHGGVWVLDLRVPEEPVVSGYFMPAVDTGYTPPPTCCIGWNLDMVPMVFDVEVDEDYNVYAADLATGFYVIEWDGPA